jgi:flagellar hook-basal body complex protein FliE
MDAISILRTLRPDLSGAGNRGVGVGLPTGKAIPMGELEGIQTASPGGTGAVGGTNPSFATTLNRLVEEVGQKQEVSRETVNAVLSGENVPLHQAMVAMEEASVSFQLMVEVRNKLLESYQELMRMQV